MSEHLPKLKYLDPEILQKIGNLELNSKSAVEGSRVGSHRSRLRGFSTEFAHHRQYAPGDPIRDLDWRVFGRTDRFYTKLYEAETNFDCYILLDGSTSMTYASESTSKLEYAKHLTATLSYFILNQRDTVGLSIFDSAVRTYIPPSSTMGLVLQIDQALSEIKPTPKETLAKQLHDIALQIKRQSFVVVISDLFSDVDDIMKGLDHLRFDGHNVIVMHTLDPYELEFPFNGTWKFEALEDEDELITQPERIKEDYLNSIKEYLNKLSSSCINSQIDYNLINTSHSIDQVVREFLQKRSAM